MVLWLLTLATCLLDGLPMRQIVREYIKEEEDGGEKKKSELQTNKTTDKQNNRQTK